MLTGKRGGGDPRAHARRTDGAGLPGTRRSHGLPDLVLVEPGMELPALPTRRGVARDASSRGCLIKLRCAAPRRRTSQMVSPPSLTSIKAPAGLWRRSWKWRPETMAHAVDVRMRSGTRSRRDRQATVQALSNTVRRWRSATTPPVAAAASPAAARDATVHGNSSGDVATSSPPADGTDTCSSCSI